MQSDACMTLCREWGFFGILLAASVSLDMFCLLLCVQCIYVCSVCMQCVYAVYVCSVCVQCMCAVYVCSVCMQCRCAVYVVCSVCVQCRCAVYVCSIGMQSMLYASHVHIILMFIACTW